MVEFGFDLKHLFPQPIIRVQADALRPKLLARHPVLPYIPQQRQRGSGQPAPAVGSSCELSQILDVMGQLSAVAQGLRHPVTTAAKLTPDQVVYLMADKDAAGRWTVAGLLKVGTKDLFVFDNKGSCRRADQTPAILDFYVHESRQRRGLGKQLFQRMLDEQGWTAGKCSVDRPSDKLLAFLDKHYGLVSTIPQGNNFVLYEGFFENPHAKILSARSRLPGGPMRSQSQGHHLRQTQTHMQTQQQTQQQPQGLAAGQAVNPRHYRRDIAGQGPGSSLGHHLTASLHRRAPWETPRNFNSMH
ncbi:alpha-tubulin N-acetyltransferase 2 [Drosophila biarmipes]|uniref:alpha-tubulin N-acetyltransferase 2 n=1 Tax=Drosophila biarmipes TaxID=125945 RepID=UPI0007E82C98|nr:alpha-tubulin N-acetyltransferase 2 [Drosophila biarmipes]